MALGKLLHLTEVESGLGYFMGCSHGVQLWFMIECGILAMATAKDMLLVPLGRDQGLQLWRRTVGLVGEDGWRGGS